MSGFDKGWLALREPADGAARSGGLVDALADHLAGKEDTRILDIGCGTGSTWRALNGQLASAVSWQLLDYDPLLLEEAERRIPPNKRVGFRRHDLNDIDGLPLDGVNIVTASALFDLCSERFCEALADRLASAACGLYAALNYDGAMRWSIPHPLDERMVDLFNRHQRTDKGLGPALGPDATACLARHLTARAFSVKIEESPWQLDTTFSDLQAELLRGFRQPLLDISDLPERVIDNWLAYRLAAIGEPGSSCLVGHADLLALPA